MFVFSIELQTYEECTACGKTTYLRCIYVSYTARSGINRHGKQ